MENGYYRITWDFGRDQSGEDIDSVFNGHTQGGTGDAAYVLEAKGYHFTPVVVLEEDDYEFMVKLLKEKDNKILELLTRILEYQEGERKT